MRRKQCAEAGTGQDAAQSQGHQYQDPASSVLPETLNQGDGSEKRNDGSHDTMGPFLPGQQMGRNGRK
jgi:hypothetical protein